MSKLPKTIHGREVLVNPQQQAAITIENIADELGAEVVAAYLREVCVTRLAQEENGLKKFTPKQRFIYQTIAKNLSEIWTLVD
jgi:hypothetical protein